MSPLFIRLDNIDTIQHLLLENTLFTNVLYHSVSAS